MAAVPVCSDFTAQENEVCHCFKFFPIYLPWTDGTGYYAFLSEQCNEKAEKIEWEKL